MRLETVEPNQEAVTRGRADGTQDAHLRDLADGMLRRVARAARLEEVVDRDVRELMRRTCDAARTRGVRAEHLLVLLKEAWQELPEARRVPRHNAGDVLARVITVCVHEYYTGADGR